MQDNANARALTRRGFVQVMGVTCLGAAIGQMGGCAPASESKGGGAEKDDVSVDVLVVGGGGSGLAAATTAAEAGKTVAVIEQLNSTGGTFALSGCETVSLDDGTGEYMDARALFDYWMEETKNNADEELMANVTGSINDTLAWVEGLGVKMHTLTNYSRPDASAPILFKSPSETAELASGGVVTNALAEKFEQLGGTIYLKTAAKSLIVDDSGAVAGVVAESNGKARRFMAKKTILAAGSFESGIGGEGNPVINGHFPNLLGQNIVYSAQGYTGATGHAITMGKDIGAEIHFEIPYVRGRFVYQASGGTLREDGVLVNGDGRRFGNEAGLYRGMYETAVEKGGAEKMFSIMDQQNCLDDMEQYAGNENMLQAETTTELAALMGADTATFVNTIEKYNAYSATGIDEDYQKPAEHLVSIDGDPLYAEKVSLLVGGCIGGLVVDGCARVISEEGQPIPNLYAAGDTANSSFHRGTYLGSGSNTCFALNSGRLAAREAVSDL